MRKAAKALLLFLFAILFASCTFSRNSPHRTPTDLPSWTIGPKTTTTSTASTQPIPLISTAIAAKTQAAPREVNCFRITSENAHPIQTEGVLVLSGEFYQTQSYLMDLQKGNRIPLGQSKDEMLTGFSVSPNQKWLVYQRIDTKSRESQIQIVDADGKALKIINWESSWRKIAGWLDNQTILISKNRGINEIDSIVKLNFIAGQIDEIFPSFPDMWIIWADHAFGWGNYNTSGTIYNSDLSRVIYPVSDEHKSGVVLWNLPDQKKVTSLFGGFGNQPKWDPNEEGFLIDLSVRYQGNARIGEDFFYVDREGRSRRITHLNESDGEASIGFFNWSPGGKSIAFWLSMTNTSYPDIFPGSPVGFPNRLAILNFENGEVIDTCLPGDLNLSPPVWSADGQYIAIEDYYDSSAPFNGRVFLADVVRGMAIEIADNVTPMGWMKPIN